MVNKKRVSSILILALLITSLFSGFAFAADADMVLADDVEITAVAHVQKEGDIKKVGKGEVEVGTTGRSLRMEALKLDFKGLPDDMKVLYKGHIQKDGDTDWIDSSKAIVGTTGQSKRLERVAIKLVDKDGKQYPGYSIEYQVHMQSYDWGKDKDNNKRNGKDAWAKDGEWAGTEGEAKRVEAVRIRIKKDNEPKIIGLEAIGAKKLEVKFNKAVDTDKAKIGVKKGSIIVNTDKVEFTADKKSAVITTTTNLTKGEYTVTVSGLTEEALTATVPVENVKVASINITSTKAPRLANDDTKALVSYEVLNQYGEKMTPTGITWTVSTGKQAVDDGKGTLTIEAASPTGFIPGQVVYITGVHAASGTVVNAQVEIALASKADSVVFKGVYDKKDNKLVDLPAGFAADRYVLLLQVKDQYGNTIAADSIKDLDDLVFTSDNPLFVSSDLKATDPIILDGVNYNAVALKPGINANNGGFATIKAISVVTGKTSVFSIYADAKSTVKTFTMSAPDKIIAEGEKVEIPFTAVDQYGKQLTKYDDLAGAVTLSPKSDDGVKPGLWFEKQKDGSAKLFYNAPENVASENADYPVYLTSVVIGGNHSNLMIYVKDEAKPAVVAGVDKNLVTNVAVGGKFELNRENIVVKDQYGRDFDLKDKLDQYPIEVSVKSGDAYLELSGDAVIRNNDAKVTVTGKAKGTAQLTIKLEGIANSDYTLNVNISETKDFESYEIGDLKTMYASIKDEYAQALTVYGIKANGSKVVLPKDYYKVTTNNAGLVYDEKSGKLKVASEDIVKPDKEVAVKVIVVVEAYGKAETLIKDVVVAKPALTVDEAKWVKTDKVTIEDGVLLVSADNADTTDNLVEALELKDQFGVKLELLDETGGTKDFKVFITNISNKDIELENNGTRKVAIKNAEKDDTFFITVVIDGKTYTNKVKVTD